MSDCNCLGICEHQKSPFSQAMDRVRFLESENARLRDLLNGFRYSGCLTGDCPHEREVECFNALAAYANEVGHALEQTRKGLKAALHKLAHWDDNKPELAGQLASTEQESAE